MQTTSQKVSTREWRRGPQRGELRARLNIYVHVTGILCARMQARGLLTWKASRDPKCPMRGKSPRGHPDRLAQNVRRAKIQREALRRSRRLTPESAPTRDRQQAIQRRASLSLRKCLPQTCETSRPRRGCHQDFESNLQKSASTQDFLPLTHSGV